MSARLESMQAMVKNIAHAVVEEAVPLALAKVVPIIARQVEQALREERMTVHGAVYVTTKAAAQMMSAHPATVRQLIAQGKLRRYSVEGQHRVKVSDIHRYIGREAGAGLAPIDLDQRAMSILGGKTASNDV